MAALFGFVHSATASKRTSKMVTTKNMLRSEILPNKYLLHFAPLRHHQSLRPS
jgi:hypothetical protein